FYVFWLISAWKTRSPVKRKQSRLSFFMYGIIWVALWVFLINWLSPDLLSERIVPAGIGYTIAGLLLTLAGLALRSGPGSTWERTGAGCLPSVRITRSPGPGRTGSCVTRSIQGSSSGLSGPGLVLGILLSSAASSSSSSCL